MRNRTSKQPRARFSWKQEHVPRGTSAWRPVSAWSVNAFDAIIVGLGHAGAEAALACARKGLKTAAITLRLDGIAAMSCNPSIGGTAKGHLVRELDALGGEMARAADLAGTHFITLNASRGPAVQATRVLCDRDAYALAIQGALKAEPNLTIMEGEVEALIAEGTPRPAIRGVHLANGAEVQAPLVIVTTGTFLKALMHVGSEKSVGGRAGDAAATGLSESLKKLGFHLDRFKTGTPPRLFHDSIDWSVCPVQPGEAAPRPFSLRSPHSPFPLRPQLACHITHTAEATHQLLRANLAHAPLFTGQISGRGPRYCPSIEDKVVRFASRDRHIVFLQPEGALSPLVYPAGLSTSMPREIQDSFLRTIPGLANVKVARFGYAVEYDYVPPTQLLPTLETKQIAGLYLAGQLNGTSGYEEAAFQGLIAGINGALQVRGEPPLVLGRSEAHGGVLIDEIVSKGVDEPFRMLTSRSEFRLALREGNAEFRLREVGHRVGLVSDAQLLATRARRARIDEEVERLAKLGKLQALRQPSIRYATLMDGEGDLLAPDLAAEVEAQVKYEGYLKAAIAGIARDLDVGDDRPVPMAIDWSNIPALSMEIREKLGTRRPTTWGHLRKIPGVTPPALNAIAIHLRRLEQLDSGSPQWR